MMVLTAHLGGRAEGSRHLWVHRDVEALLFLDSLVALFNPRADPAAEDASQDRGAHIADPLLRDFVDFLGVRHEVEHLLVPVVQERGNVLEGQPLVLGDCDVPDVLRLHAYNKKE